jgi:hypothetical protein
MIVAVHRPAGADVSPRCPVIGGYPERINERIQSIACSKRPVRREPVGEAGLDIEIVHDVRCRPGQLVKGDPAQGYAVAAQGAAPAVDDSLSEHLPSTELGVAKQHCSITGIVEGSVRR